MKMTYSGGGVMADRQGKKIKVLIRKEGKEEREEKEKLHFTQIYFYKHLLKNL